jgi:hypothetical protein
MTKDFLDDSNIRSITDIFRYTSSGSGDNRFAMARPANSATPQGGFTLRGFPINSRPPQRCLPLQSATT